MQSKEQQLHVTFTVFAWNAIESKKCRNVYKIIFPSYFLFISVLMMYNTIKNVFVQFNTQWALIKINLQVSTTRVQHGKKFIYGFVLQRISFNRDFHFFLWFLTKLVTRNHCKHLQTIYFWQTKHRKKVQKINYVSSQALIYLYTVMCWSFH